MRSRWLGREPRLECSANFGEPNKMSVRYVLASVLSAAALLASMARAAAADEPTDPNLIARGSYLARAADCMPCHTSAKDKPYAGGLRLNTPFGAIYSPNITSDRDT